MFKHFLWLFIRGFLGCILAFWVHAIVAAIFGSLFSSIGVMIFSSIIMAIVCIIYRFAVLKHFLEEEEYADIWTTDKKIKSITVQLWILPKLLIAVALLIFLISAYKNSLFGEFILGYGFISAISTFWFFHWLFMFLYFNSQTCHNCHAVMCWKNDGRSNYHETEREQTKTRDTYGTIGEVYLDNQKVGEVKGTTGSYTRKRTIKTTSYISHYICQFCGNKKSTAEFRSTYGDWK